MNEITKTLKEKVKEDIYLDFRVLLDRMDHYAQMPITPSRLAYLSAFMNLYISIKNKLEKQIKQDKDKYSKFQVIIDYMNQKKAVKDLELDKCNEMTFLLAEFLDLIGITTVWD